MPKKMTLKWTPEIKRVMTAYNDARPQNLDASVALNAAGEVAGVFDGVADEAATVILKNADGFKALAVAGLLGAVKAVVSNVFTMAAGAKTELQVTYQLDYLQRYTLPKNANLSDEQLARLQECYDAALTYQQLKMSRGIFLGIGQNYQEDQIADPKYLANILIARKIVEAANAGNFEEYNKHVTHLHQYLKNIVNDEALLSSRSDDTDYLSLRALIMTVVDNLQESEVNVSTEVSRLQRVRELLDDNLKVLDKVLKESQSRFMLLATKYNSKDVEVKQLQANKSELQRLNSVQEQQADENLQNLIRMLSGNRQVDANKVKQLLQDATGVSEDKITEPMLNAAVELLKLQVNIVKINDDLLGLKKNINLKGFNVIVHDVGVVLAKYEELKKSLEMLHKKENEVRENLRPLRRIAANQDYKNKFLRVQVAKSEPAPCDKIDESIFLLGMINAQKLVHQPEGEVTALEESIRLGRRQDDPLSDFMSSVVVVDESENEEKIRKLEAIVENQKSRIDEKNKLIKEKNKEIERLQGEQHKAKSYPQYQSNAHSTIRSITKDFYLLLDDYEKYTRKGFLFFGAHGIDGRIRAEFIRKEFQNEIDKIECDANLSEKSAINKIRNVFDKIVCNNVDILNGNHRKHSLKTYLAFFSEYLKAKNGDNSDIELKDKSGYSISLMYVECVDPQDDHRASFEKTFNLKNERRLDL